MMASTAALAPEIVRRLPARQAQIALDMGRKPSDGTVRRTLGILADAGVIERVDGVWRCQELPDWPRLREISPPIAGALALEGMWPSAS